MHAEPQIGSRIAQAASQRRAPVFALVMVVLAAVLAVFWPTLWSMIEIWNRSATFMHGWLVIPAFVWFAWERRDRLAAIPPRPFWPGLLAVAAGGFGWLLADLAGVGVVEQAAMIGLVAACIVTVLGWRVGWELAFPLAFLFFAVPVGEGLTPVMMEMTADFTIAALEFSGVPVFREGLYFVIPSGSWSVVESCSGLRYLIASVTVGCVFAYLYYRSIWRRLAFIAASIAVPIVANWLRAYMIVMLGHLSGNKIAVGADHLVYGWLFFGLVMLLLFSVGARWREDDEPEVAQAPLAGIGAHVQTSATVGPLAGAALATLLVAAAWPAWSAYVDHRAGADVRLIELSPPQDAGGWHRLPEQVTDWRPRYQGARASIFETYGAGDRKVALYLAVYRDQRRSGELISSANIMVEQKHRVWSNVGESRRVETIGAGSLPVRRTLLRSAEQRLVVWDWAVIGGRDVVNPYVAKLLQARDQILGRGDDSVAILVAAPYEAAPAASPAAAEQSLREFVAAMRGSIDAAAASALGR